MIHFNIGIAGALGLIFITLQLTGFIAWPWLWVLAPFWLPLVIWACLWACMIGAVLVVALVAAAFGKH
jgi:hypothetical protein